MLQVSVQAWVHCTSAPPPIAQDKVLHFVLPLNGTMRSADKFTRVTRRGHCVGCELSDKTKNLEIAISFGIYILHIRI